jgi:hypothetical protein
MANADFGCSDEAGTPDFSLNSDHIAIHDMARVLADENIAPRASLRVSACKRRLCREETSTSNNSRE